MKTVKAAKHEPTAMRWSYSTWTRKPGRRPVDKRVFVCRICGETSKRRATAVRGKEVVCDGEKRRKRTLSKSLSASPGVLEKVKP